MLVASVANAYMDMLEAENELLRKACNLGIQGASELWSNELGKRFALEAENASLRAENQALRRLWVNNYVEWGNAGGTNECKHGYAAGIHCMGCDIELVKWSTLPFPPRPE